MNLEIIKWVNIFFKNRISNELSIHFDAGYWFFSFHKNSNFLKIKFNPLFYSNSIPSKCTYINIDSLDLHFLEFEKDNLDLSLDNESNLFDFDFIGGVFWYVNRLEEYACANFDNNERYAFTNSIAYKFNLILIPVVDEYVAYLSHAIFKRCNDITFNNKETTILQTFDVDRPFGIVNKNVFTLLRHIVKSILNLNFVYAISIFNIWIKYLFFRNINLDPVYNFDKIFNTLKKFNYKAVFFIITGRSNFKHDGDSDISFENIISLINNIYVNGFSVGFHFSYDSYNNLKILLREFTSGNACFGHFTPISRQHYLRYNINQTPKYLNKVGINVDFTLGYPEHVGFRCGTSHKFKMFDFNQMTTLELEQSPLIAMDVTMFGKNYMSLDYIQSVEILSILYHQVEKYNGDFVLLWHNDQLSSDRFSFFEQILERYSISN